MWTGTVMRLLLSVTVFLVSGDLASAQLRHPRVCTDDGCILGTSMTDTSNLRFDAFVGIPFAKPPVGKLRFKKPIPVDPWTEEYDATESKPACLQKSFLQIDQPVIGDEDCLYLNVYRPKTNGSERFPVMVFIHGGGFFFGSATPQLYGPERFLATKRVIFVTIQYRLGLFGFLSTGDDQAVGNFGMLDQTLALKWVQRHIAAFGGNPEAVTLFGESAGGSSVQLHMMSPLSRGLFQRAIIMSGSALAVWSLPVEDPLEVARKQAKLVGVSEADELTTAELVDVLQYLDAKVLTASMPFLRSWFEHPIVIYRPSVQGPSVPEEERFLPDDPRKLWSEGRFMDIPMMIGTVPNEGAVVSLAILHNETILQQFNEQLADIFPAVASINATPAVLERLKQRYFPDAPEDRWINEDNSHQLTEMLSDCLIKYPTMQTLLDYNSKAGTCRQTTFYSFEFEGRHSFSSFYVPSNASYGVCHQDELPYLFRMVDLFPDFPPDSPEARMADVFTEFFVDFATEGTPEAPPEACGEKVKSVTFSNAKSSPEGEPPSPVSVSSGTGLGADLQNMYEFWRDLYASAFVNYS